MTWIHGTQVRHGFKAASARFMELVLPPLRDFCDIITTKSHLDPWLNPVRLDKMLPGLGQTWATKQTLMTIFNDLVLWTRKFEAVLARMKTGDNSLLAPIVACDVGPVTFALQMMKEAVSKKEMAQLEASQGKNTAAVTAIMASGAEPDAKAET